MASPQSKRRRADRIRQDEMATLAALRAAGANCGNCQHVETKSPYTGASFKTWCGLKSDSDGFCPVDADHLCMGHTPKVPLAACAVADRFFKSAMEELGFLWSDRRSGSVRTMLANGYSVEQIRNILLPPAKA